MLLLNMHTSCLRVSSTLSCLHPLSSTHSFFDPPLSYIRLHFGSSFPNGHTHTSSPSAHSCKAVIQHWMKCNRGGRRIHKGSAERNNTIQRLERSIFVVWCVNAAIEPSAVSDHQGLDRQGLYIYIVPMFRTEGVPVHLHGGERVPME